MKYTFFSVVSLLLIFLQIILSLFFYRLDYHDLFYLSLANQSMHHINLYSTDPTTGNPDFSIIPFYILESWELLLSLIGYVFHIPIPILTHTVIPIFLIFLSYMAYANLFSILIEKEFFLMLVFVSIFHIMGGYSNFSQGNFLLARMWHGKMIYLHIMLPMLQYYSLKYINNHKINNIIVMCSIFIASIGLNPSSIYLSSFVISAFIIAGLISNLKEYKQVFKLGFVFIPIFLYVVLIYSSSRKYLGEWHVEALLPLNFIHDLKLFIGNGTYFYYFIIIIPFFLLSKKYESLKILSIYTIILVVFLLNPFSSKVVADYLTSSQTYWRVFWLIPLGTFISIFGVILVKLCNHKKYLRIVSLALISIILIISVKFMYTSENKFVSGNSYYKILNEIVEKANYLKEKEKMKILAHEESSMYLRSIASNVELVYTRYAYLVGFLGEESKELGERIEMFEITNGNVTYYNNFISLIRKYKVDKIVFNK